MLPQPSFFCLYVRGQFFAHVDVKIFTDNGDPYLKILITEIVERIVLIAVDGSASSYAQKKVAVAKRFSKFVIDGYFLPAAVLSKRSVANVGQFTIEAR